MNFRNIFVGFSALILSASVSAQIFPGTNLGAIPDGAGEGQANYGAPRDVEFNVAGTIGTVGNIEVSFSAAHTWVGDLKVSLIAPNGTSHLLFERTGSTSNTGGDSGSNANLIAHHGIHG